MYSTAAATAAATAATAATAASQGFTRQLCGRVQQGSASRGGTQFACLLVQKYLTGTKGPYWYKSTLLVQKYLILEVGYCHMRSHRHYLRCRSTSSHACVCICEYTHIYACIYMYIYVYIHVYVCMHVCMYVCMYSLYK